MAEKAVTMILVRFSSSKFQVHCLFCTNYVVSEISFSVPYHADWSQIISKFKISSQ